MCSHCFVAISLLLSVFNFSFLFVLSGGFFFTALHLHLVVFLLFFIGLCHLQFIFSPFISLSVLSLNLSWVIMCLFPVI